MAHEMSEGCPHCGKAPCSNVSRPECVEKQTTSGRGFLQFAGILLVTGLVMKVVHVFSPTAMWVALGVSAMIVILSYANYLFEPFRADALPGTPDTDMVSRSEIREALSSRENAEQIAQCTGHDANAVRDVMIELRAALGVRPQDD